VTTSVITAPPAGPESAPEPRATTRWFRPGFAGVLVLAALVDLWDVGSNGTANAFYAAAVQASTRNPVAWLFAAVDAPGFITVDKPPADNWWMGLWANLFGFSPWSMLVPQAVLGIATVALLVLTVRRWSGPGAALVAGAVLALTPVAVIMFRFDDPDPMLTFLLVAAAYALVRALDAAARRAGTWFLIACGLLIGLGFLAKMGVALLVVPAFALVYLVASAVPWRRRIGQLVAGLGGIVVGAGWFLALVAVWPASSRPWIGGSTDNSLLQLAVGYNGVSRLVGRSGGPGAGPGRGGAPGGFAGFGGQAGLGRMFSTEFGGQIAWLLPAALLALVALLWLSRRAPADDRLRAAALLWGGWLVVSAAVFSFMAGIVHSYYTIVMAPAIAALVAIGAREAWRRRAEPAARITAAVGVLGTAIWSAVLLGRSPTFVPWLPGTVLVAGVLAALLIVVPTVLARRAGVVATLVLGLVATLGGASAYAIDTVVTPHAGTEASAGPTVRDARASRFTAGPGRTTRAGQAGQAARAAGANRGGPGGGGGFGAADPQVTALLRGAGTQWSAATPTTMAAAGLELASDTSVMGLGGFSGSDPTPTLAQFQADVSGHLVRFYVAPAAGGQRGFGGGGGRGAALAPIQAWVQAHWTGTRVGADTVYDLSAAPH
jgi:4-amino-4-deoxy-L-arabinose transferase-like glycosyltransferase